METAIEKANSAAIEPSTQRGIITAAALKEAAEQRALLNRYVKEQMDEGTDFGKIPGTEKPTLLKPGAEKLVDLFHCTPRFAMLHREVDHERGLYDFTFRVRLYQRDIGAVVAEGFGSANSREGRYRWRNANRRCPKCGAETVFASKHDPGFYCWAKKGGCGAKFGPTDETITSQTVGRVENDDIATLANTILKMAKKRALVDGAIALARCSDMFTQDAEDMESPEDRPAAKPQPSAPPAPSTRATQSAKPYVIRTNGGTKPAQPSTPASAATVDVPPTKLGEPSALEKLLIEAQELSSAAGVPDQKVEQYTASILQTAAKEGEVAARARAHKWIGGLKADAKRTASEPPLAEPPPPTDADAPGADSQE